MKLLVRRRTGAVVAASTLALALVLAVAAPAQADDGIAFTPPTQSAEYGQNWSVSGKITPQTYDDFEYGSLSLTTGSTTKNLGTDRLSGGVFNFGDYDFDLDLGVGTHSFSAAFTGGYATATSTTPAVVTITPAQVLATTTIAPDPNNSLNAIITSQLTGKFVDQLPNCDCEDQDGYLLPAGTWKLTVTDSSGNVVLTKQVSQPASGLPTFVNYWQNVPPGETFSAAATFTITGAGASNFMLTSQKFSWTSSKSGAGGGTSPSSTPKPTTIKPASFAPPVLVFWAVLLVALILIALDILLYIRRRRSLRAASATGASPEVHES